MSNAFYPHVDEQESEGVTIRITRSGLIATGVGILLVVGLCLFFFARDAAIGSSAGGLW